MLEEIKKGRDNDIHEDVPRNLSHNFEGNYRWIGGGYH